MSELKPCPFCGNEKVFLDCWEGIHGQNWFVHCKKCRTTFHASDGFMAQGFPNAQAASAAWNRRAEVKGDGVSS